VATDRVGGAVALAFRFRQGALLDADALGVARPRRRLLPCKHRCLIVGPTVAAAAVLVDFQATVRAAQRTGYTIELQDGLVQPHADPLIVPNRPTPLKS